MRTQMLDGNSPSDVTVQDVEELSRAPKRRLVTLHSALDDSRRDGRTTHTV